MAVRTLVAYRALGLGDFLSGVPALRALADAFPAHRRVLAAPAPLAPLLELAGCEFELVDCRPPAPLPRALAGVEVAVNLHGRGPESHRALLTLRPAYLLAFAHPDVLETEGMPRWRNEEHEVLRWCRLLQEHEIPASPSRLLLEPPPARLAPVLPGATVVHPGAAAPARRWPAKRFAAVARAERDSGRRVVVTGSEDELALAHFVASAAGLEDDDVLAGRTDTAELAALVAHAGRVVCGDTGVAHLASAFGTPSVVLYGPVPPRLWGPPPDRPQHIALWAGREGDPHGETTDPGLLEIEVADVLAALADLKQRLNPLAAAR